MENWKQRWYKRLPVILSLIAIAISGTILVWNIPMPYLEVGTFPYKIDHLSVHVGNIGSIETRNDSLPDTSLPSQNVSTPKLSTATVNVTFQVMNSGKAPAHNVRITLRGEPAEGLKVVFGYVYVGEPLQSNLLDTIKDEYEIGLIGIGKSYTFTFVLEMSTRGKYVLTVTSDDTFPGSYTLFID
jgi:hypothetical protein